MKAYDAEIKVKEYPFLENLFKDEDALDLVEDVQSVKVKRMNPGILSRIGYEESYDSCDFQKKDYTIYFAVVEVDGTFDIHELNFAGNRKHATHGESEWGAPTVGEQIFALGINPDYIVETTRKDDWAFSDSAAKPERHWVIYKLKDFPLAEDQCREVDAVARSLKPEIRLADGQKLDIIFGTDEELYWFQIVEEVNDRMLLLKEKPRSLKKHCSNDSPGCVLNAYREGDLTFDEAVAILEKRQ